jgi:hypothetical protein
VLATIEQIGAGVLLDPKASRARQYVLAMIANRILEPGSKLAAARARDGETRHSTLGEELKLERVDEDDLYEAMDWLLSRQAQIQASLAPAVNWRCRD